MQCNDGSDEDATPHLAGNSNFENATLTEEEISKKCWVIELWFLFCFKFELPHWKNSQRITPCQKMFEFYRTNFFFSISYKFYDLERALFFEWYWTEEKVPACFESAIVKNWKFLARIGIERRSWKVGNRNSKKSRNNKYFIKWFFLSEKVFNQEPLL